MAPLLRIFIVCFCVGNWLACTEAPDRLGTLDLATWRADRGSCSGQRAELREAFNQEQGRLIGKSANDIGQLLGRPDVHQLGGRNQKVYVYFMEKGIHCNDITQPSKALKAILRFNAVGLLTEVSIQTQPLE